MSKDSNSVAPEEEGAKYCVSINDLPTEVVKKILSFVPFGDLATSVPRVCKLWYEASKDLDVWERVDLILSHNTKVIELARALRVSPYLRSVSFESAAVEIDVIKTLLDCCDRIRHIRFNMQIMNFYPFLKEIFSKFDNVESAVIWLPCLDEKVRKLIGKLTLHTFVVPFDCPDHEPSEGSLRYIAEGCPNLIHIDIRGVPFSREDIVHILSCKKGQLQAFLFDGRRVTRGTILPFRDCPHLTNIQCVRTPPHMLESIVSSSEMTTLGLDGLQDVPSDTLVDFFDSRSFPNVTKLDLSSYWYMDVDLAATIRYRLPNIRVLRFKDSFHVCDPGVEELLKFDNLQELECSYLSSFSPQWFEQLLQCKKLKTLKISGSIHVTDEIAEQFISRLQLRYLYLTGCISLTDDFLRTIPNSKTLEKLVFKDCRFSMDAIQKACLRKKFTRIRFVNCRYCK